MPPVFISKGHSKAAALGRLLETLADRIPVEWESLPRAHRALAIELAASFWPTSGSVGGTVTPSQICHDEIWPLIRA